MKSKRLVLGSLLLAASLASAGADAQSDDGAPSVAAISGYFSQGFGIAIVDGLKRAEEELGIGLKIVDTGNRALDYEEQFNNLARGGEYDLIFVMGWELVDALLKSNEAYPEQRFVFIDGVLDSDSITYVDFLEEEGSFLVGALAAELTAREVDGFDNSSSVGFLGGRDIPVIRNFLSGMEQGVAHVGGEVSVSDVFAGTFDDPAKGSELAMTLYGQGIDIVYQAAGPTGEGVLQAARAARKYAVGVDIDQCGSAPGHILASMLKRADLAVYDLIEQESNGEPVEPGQIPFGVASGGIELKICDEVRDRVPDEVVARMEELRSGIADGSLEVALGQ